MDKITIPTTTGDQIVPCLRGENCHNLCVTMTNFGSFEITHIHSGRKLFGGFERAINAMREVVIIELCLQEIGIDRSLPMEPFQKAISLSSNKFDRLSDTTIVQYIKSKSTIMSFAGEFPWEIDEDCPFNKVEKLKEEFKK